MKFKSSPSTGSGEFRGFLGQGTELTGDLSFSDMMRIDGHINGHVNTTGHLIIGETGMLEAGIKVGVLSVSGTIKGTIVATEKVEIHKTGKVYGDIFTPVLNIEEGAIFEGKCQMSKAAREAAAALEHSVNGSDGRVDFLVAESSASN
ncbi:MAG TPA: polymer-forming cytoskeletal protein [Blastocatellia bacterium]|nr:polymer-forming cytoskeletal protein [Blastocatellia bacterium]